MGVSPTETRENTKFQEVGTSVCRGGETVPSQWPVSLWEGDQRSFENTDLRSSEKGEGLKCCYRELERVA